MSVPVWRSRSCLATNIKPMTAEVAIANKMAVALAADSAATSSSNKIYSSQKLFPLLDQDHAVGVMIFQNAEFMGIPWETIISMYRQSHADNPQPTIQHYVQDFLEYIGKAPFCTEAQESANVLSIVGAALRLLGGGRTNCSPRPETAKIVESSLEGVACRSGSRRSVAFHGMRLTRRDLGTVQESICQTDHRDVQWIRPRESRA